MSPEKRRRIGPYELEKQLGGGGQGQVWRARSSDSGELVALKLFSLGIDEEQASETRRRVDREVRALSGLNRPALVRILSHGEAEDGSATNDGFIYVAYELIDGVELGHELEAALPPSPADCLALLERLAPDLEAVHQKGLVHRDIKPSNILLRDYEWSDPVLVDFGYVKAIGSGKLTVTGRAVGTDGYIAPEVLKAPQAASPASDQWSLSRILAEALSVALDADVKDATQLPSDDLLREWIVPAAPCTGAVLDAGLAPDPAERYDGVEALAKAVRAAMLVDELISVPEPSSTVTSPWDGKEPLREYVGRLGFETNDKRSRPNGCLWVVADRDSFSSIANHLAEQGVRFLHAPAGGKATRGRPGWWTKSGN